MPVADLASYKGKAFLGIDAGSTTTKAALVGEDGTYYTPSITAMMEILLVRQSQQSKIFTVSFRKESRLRTPALPDTARH